MNFRINFCFEIEQSAIDDALYYVYNQHTLPRFGYRLRRTVDGTKVLAQSPGGQGNQPTRQRFCALNLRFIVVAKIHYIQSPNVRVYNCARPLNIDCCVGPDTPCATVPPTPSLRFAHRYAANVLAIARRNRFRYLTGMFVLVRHRTCGPHSRISLPLYSFFPSFPDPYYRHPDTF